MSENKAFKEFAFGKTNYMLMLIGVVIIVIGFFVMSGGGSDDPGVFKGDYCLTSESFDKMVDDFEVNDEVKQQLRLIENKVFPSEIELKEAMTNILGDTALEENYYALRSATEIDADIFNTRRLTIAPIIVLFGYAFIMYAILKKIPGVTVKEEEWV